MDQDYSKQTTRDICDSDAMCTSSLKEISLIETVTSFLEENGAGEVDPRILKNLAEALSKRISTDEWVLIWFVLIVQAACSVPTCIGARVCVCCR